MIERDRRALVLGSTTILAGVLLLRVLPSSVRHAVAARVEVRERAALLARAREDLAETVLLRDSAAALGRALIELAPKLLSGATAAEAIADLSGRLNLAATRSAAKLERVEPLPDSATAGRLRRVRLRARLESDIRGVAGVLHAVEFNEAALSVNEVQIVPVDPTSAGRLAEVLHVEVTVTGWYLSRLDADHGPGTLAE